MDLDIYRGEMMKHLMIAASVLGGFMLLSNTAKADTTTNIDSRIEALNNKKQTENVKREKAALKATKVNLSSRNLKMEEDKKEDDKVDTPKPEQQEHAQPAKPVTPTVQVSQKPQVVNNPPKQVEQVQKPENVVSGLDLNQTSGSVNVTALANYLAQHKGTFSAGQWANIIMRESGGSLTAQNPSGAYGVLQLLGHGEHPDMTLGQQIQMAMPLPASAWAETAY